MFHFFLSWCTTRAVNASYLKAEYAILSSFQDICQSYCTTGGENGFNQAIMRSAEMLANVKFVQEKKLITKFFDEISQDTGKFVFGVSDTLQCLEMGAVETLIVWENLAISRFTLLNTGTGWSNWWAHAQLFSSILHITCM